MSSQTELSERQRREIEYHRSHAQLVAEKYRHISHDVVYSSQRRWWNAYWYVFGFLKKTGLRGKNVLVVGCGAGEDATRMALLGANVFAFDLSEEMLEIAKQVASDAGASVDFTCLPAESLTYSDSFFDCIFCRDIFHHIDIPRAVIELRRVAKPGAFVIINEVYSHSVTEVVRRSRLVEEFLYPRMRRIVYAGRPYITEDERKLSEKDISIIESALHGSVRKSYFNFIVTRLIPDRFTVLNRLDRVAILMTGPLARFLGGRVVIVGHFKKP